MRLGSLFSGRGGFEIGAKTAGIETSWTCEIDDFLHYKLKRIVTDEKAKHYRDIRFVKNPPTVEIISAGFPCQDISVSNHKFRKGIKGIRSGLWSEVARIAEEVKPRYLVLENSPELLKQGFEYVLRDLSAIGYNAEWDCWRAADFGYPHNRRRLYVIAYAYTLGFKSDILKPPGSFELLHKWTPAETYIRVSISRAKGFRNNRVIQRDYEFPHFKREIAAFGNAVMPVVAEHLFKCILTFEKNNEI